MLKMMVVGEKDTTTTMVVSFSPNCNFILIMVLFPLLSLLWVDLSAEKLCLRIMERE